MLLEVTLVCRPQKVAIRIRQFFLRHFAHVAGFSKLFALAVELLARLVQALTESALILAKRQ